MGSNEDTVPAGRGPGATAVPGTDEGLVACRYRFADVDFDEAEGQLRVAGKAVVVEPRPLRLLAELLRHVGEVVTKEELLDTVWEGRPTVDHVLANAVSKLRSALGEQGAARLATVPRVGYRLAGPVQRLAARPPEVALLAGQPVPGREAYLLERPLGSGGHSDVWLARHGKLGQAHVFKFASDGPRLSALKREYTLYRVLRQELGPRDDFAVVLDCNFTAAPYFLECEYGGLSLLEWADEGGRLAALPQAERLELFLQIARAVAAAHGMGVLHKDIKPGNVLVDRPPAAAQGWQARLTDFGSGRLLDATRLAGLQLTAQGLTQTLDHATPDSRSGTPMYLAPEVLAGQAPSMQSDVYALGLLLYQLLAGDLRRPLATGWEREIDDELLREDIAAATQGQLRARLGSVVELVQRVSTLAARHDALRLSREQQRQAESALAEQRRRKARRPWALAAFAILALGLVASAALYWRAEGLRRVAERQAARAESISEFLNKDILRAADITGVGPKKTLLIADVLASASRRAATRFGPLPEAEAEVRYQLGDLFFGLSLFKAAEQEFRRGIEVADLAGPEAAVSAVESRYGLAKSLINQSKSAAGEQALQAADQAASQAAPSAPVAAARRIELARLKAQVIALAAKRERKEAARLASRLVALTDELQPQDLRSQFSARRQWAELLLRATDHESARRVLTQMMAPPYTPESVGEVIYARAQVQMAHLLTSTNDPAGAEQLLTAARDAMASRLGERDYSLGFVHQELAEAYLAQGKFAAARSAYAEAFRTFAVAVGPDSQMTRISRVNAAIVALRGGEGTALQTLAELQENRPWFVKNMGGETEPFVQWIDSFRVRALIDLGRLDEASRLLPTLNAKAIAEADPWPHWEQALRVEQARLLLASGRQPEGRDLLATTVRQMKAAAAEPWEITRMENLLVARR